MKHLLSVNTISAKKALDLCKKAHFYEQKVKSKEKITDANGKILANVFLEPSTRTRLSFETAMLRLGGQNITISDAKSSSNKKGETLSDTLRVISAYADTLVVRQPKTEALNEIKLYKPTINAGDGAGEHPTQALLDLYTIWKRHKAFKNEEKVTITFMGDLKYGRTIHSGLLLLQKFPNIELYGVAVPEMQVPEQYQKNITLVNHLSPDLLQSTDVLYQTRVQKERFEDETQYNKVKNAFLLTENHVSQMKTEASVMHPLPRVNELDQKIDTMPQAAYFEQAENGIYMRMAILADLLQ